jgi:Rrf2 family transcriptional regulator, iron-sulfur cluster assembly transcription factor
MLSIPPESGRRTYCQNRSVLALAAVVDVAIHSGPGPVSANSLYARRGLPLRYLEPILQALVQARILKGVRGPRGGYQLARDRGQIQ